MELHDLARRVESREDLAGFIESLRRDLATNGSDWENPTLDRYLEALSAWINDMEGYFHNQGLAQPAQPTWRLVAEALYAAHLYE